VLELVADRGYTKNGAKDWAGPLRKLGVRPVMDLTQRQMGSQGITDDGVKAVNGCLACPAIPEKLIDQARIEDFETVEDREAKFDLVEKARLYEMVPHEKNPDPVTGDQRFTCPARAGKVRCVNFEPSMKASPAKVPTIYPDQSLQADPPTVCTQQTVTIRGSFAVDVRQPYLWGSQDWFDAYDRRTPNVESSFGNLRQPGKQHMARGRIMVMGKAKVSLLLTFQVAAMNIRLTDAYLRTSKKKASSRVRKKTNGQPVTRRHRAVPYAARKPTSAAQKRARGRSSPQPATA